ncbi:MAG: hypothetical protein JWR69_186 [Pedosphaera sp.]|nr:hypothetical protein [Pedosphaera sp.]
MDTKRFLPVMAVLCGLSAASAAELPAAAHFRKEVQPILTEYCFDCHADGANKGGISFDEFKSDEALVGNHDLWFAVLKNLRAGVMPPQKKPRPSPEELKKLERWVKFEAFGLDPKNPEPGRVTVRRLNRVEYHNTIRDLTRVDFDTETEFPPDDTGYGFDNIGDVLTLSPMLLEKYMDAAKSIVSKTVPITGRVVAETRIERSFRRQEGGTSNESGKNALVMSYYKPASLSNTFQAGQAGHYQLVLDLASNEKFIDDQFDYNKCRLVFKADGQELLRQDYIREGGKAFHYEFARDWQPGAHELSFALEPLTPGEQQVRSLTLRINSVTVRGPLEEKYWVAPKDYERFFTKAVPKSAADRHAYARELLRGFATKAFRRPVDDDTADRLVTLAEGLYKQRGQTFEAGVAHAMVAILTSPRFLFREEGMDLNPPGKAQSSVDEYALASRLSYFLWSSMPDDELFRLAGAGQLRQNLAAQVKRMMADSRSESLVQNFTGQWLQARDIETVAIDARAVFAREEKADPEVAHLRKRSRELEAKMGGGLSDAEREEFRTVRKTLFKLAPRPRAELSEELRKAMRYEVEMYFNDVVHQDRNVIELVESDYTFLNERLATHYGLTNLNLTGAEFRRVTLPPDSPRGGVITMGSVLAVTSNPTRTSPVKRGLFILDNILGNPAPPPPPNIPPLEDSEKGAQGHETTLREALEIHRSQPLCNSCHSRMDPPGLALENFNALGMWRDQEHGQVIDAAGKLLTGESFKNVRELKHILATQHRVEFYRTLTEKLLTYALGRGLEYYDVETVDQIVNRLEQENGRFSALLMGVIESSPFQKRQSSDKLAPGEPAKRVQQRAERKAKP